MWCEPQWAFSVGTTQQPLEICGNQYKFLLPFWGIICGCGGEPEYLVRTLPPRWGLGWWWGGGEEEWGKLPPFSSVRMAGAFRGDAEGYQENQNGCPVYNNQQEPIYNDTHRLRQFSYITSNRAPTPLYQSHQKWLCGEDWIHGNLLGCHRQRRRRRLSLLGTRTGWGFSGNVIGIGWRSSFPSTTTKWYFCGAPMRPRHALLCAAAALLSVLRVWVWVLAGGEAAAQGEVSIRKE